MSMRIERSMRKNLLAGSVALAVSILAAGRAPATCAGDCNGDGEVTVDEIVTMVNIALGTAPVSTCSAGDTSGDGEITVDEIVAAANNSLNSCPVVDPALGTRRFSIVPGKSPLIAVLGPGFAVPLGKGFQGQKNGVVGNAYLDLHAGVPDANGVASIDVTDASDYFFVDAHPTASLVLCLKPQFPVSSAGSVQCDGGQDYSIAIQTDHNVGQIGVDGYTPQQCLASCSDLGGCGSIEGPNQICAAGHIGDECLFNSDCDSASGLGDGLCGLGRLCVHGKPGASCQSDADCNSASETSDGVCGAQPVCNAGKTGEPCRADGDCESSPGSADGQCGRRAAHPGVCNGPLETGQAGGNSGAGAVVFAPINGMQGLPMELSIESALPCGDEGSGLNQGFALTSGLARATIRDFSNQERLCSNGSSCKVDSDCDAADGGPGKGVCGSTLVYQMQGENFSCSDWTKADGPGCLVLAFPALDFNPNGGDIVTGFKFCGH